MTLSQSALLVKAERLATALAGGPTRVEKNVLLSVVATFMSDPASDVERLKKTIRLLKKGNGGHLKRSTAYAQQMVAVTDELEKTLAEKDLAPQELKSLFGWTARLLLAGGIGRDAPRAEPLTPTPKPREKTQFGAINKKALSDLEALKKKLEGGDKGKP